MINSKVAVCLVTASLIVSGCSSKSLEINDLKSSANVVVSQDISSSTTVASNVPSSEPSKAPYPEPYVKAIDQFNQGDMEMAMKYLDLTISDYPSTDYVLKANVLKSYILSVQIMGFTSPFTSYTAGGITYMKGPFMNKEGADKIHQVVENGKKFYAEKTSLLKDSTTYILEHYKTKKMDVMSDTDLRASDDYIPSYDLSFFEDVGYPIPSQEEIDKATDSSTETTFQQVTPTVFKNNEVDYLEFFYIAASALRANADGNTFSKPVYEEIIKLTEDDKYNEIRIEAEDRLSKM